MTINNNAAPGRAAVESTVNKSDFDYTAIDADVITIVRDVDSPLGKHFKLMPDGKVKKSSVVTITVGRAVQRSVKTPEDLKQILEEVSQDSHAAIINAGFKGIPIGQEFFILSETVLRKKLGTDDRSKIAGVHTLPHKQHGPVLVCGRLKENVFSSSWQLLDRDIDEHTPAEYGKAMPYEDWIEALDVILPGLAQTTIVRAASTSARVLDTFSGLPVGGGNGHTWVKVSEPGRVEQIRHAIMLRSIAQDIAWKKPRLSRATGEVVGHSWTTLTDASVWTPGRLVFNGKPAVEGDLEIAAQKVEIIENECPVLDLSAVVLPPNELVERKARDGGCAVKVRQSDKGLRVDQFNLSLSTELETEDHGTISVKEALTKEGKIRCQAPFRSSESFAAFLGKSKEGRPFVHDVGTATNHWLCDDDWTELKKVSASQVLDVLRSLPQAEILEKWIPLALRLEPGERDELIQALVKLTGRGVQSLKADFKSAKDVLAKAAKVKKNKVRLGLRREIEYHPENRTRHAEQLEEYIIEAVTAEEYLSFGGLLAHITEKPLPFTHLIDNKDGEAPSVLQIESLEKVAALGLIERVAVFGTYDEEGTFNPIAVPSSIVEILIDKAEHTAPVVTGLVTHPLVLSDGFILGSNGLDATTGLFLSGVEVRCRAYDQAESIAALNRLRDVFLAGFEFESDLDADASIAGFLTGLQRRLLDSAPGLAVLASSQSSGKTTLARRIHIILTGRDMPVSTFPQNDEAEVQKRLLSILLRSPAMVCFDNIMDGTTFRSGAIAGAMTGPMLEQRILGETRVASVLTNTLFVMTGNNLQLGADEVTRWLISRLSPSTARPEERKFTNPDVVGHGLSIRDSVLQDAIGIIAGWLQSGQSMEIKSRFPRWDRMVRQPLIWAGGNDVADIFTRNTDGAEHILALESLAIGLHEIFGQCEFLAYDLVRAIHNNALLGTDLDDRLMAMGEDRRISVTSRLITALESLRTRDTSSSRSVGRCLASQVGRVAKIGDKQVRLRKKIVSGEIFYYLETVKE